MLKSLTRKIIFSTFQTFVCVSVSFHWHLIIKIVIAFFFYANKIVVALGPPCAAHSAWRSPFNTFQ